MNEQAAQPAPARALPTVSAVAINYNGGERILKTVEALCSQPFPLRQIVLVDNASTDGTTEQIARRFPRVTVLQLGGNLGPCRSRNAGVDHVDSDLVLLVDNDIYVQDDTIERMARAQQETGAAVVAPRIRLVPERDMVQAEGADVHFVGMIRMRHGWRPAAGLPDERAEVDAAISACLLVEREAYRSVGGFDELYFFYCEDMEFSVRTRSLGHRIVAEPGAVVYHERGEGIVGLSYRGEEPRYPKRRAYLLLRNRLLTMFIHLRWRTLILLAPALAVYEIASLGMALLKGFPVQWLKAWLWQFGHIPAIAERRRRMQSDRKLSDRALLSGGELPFSPGFVSSKAAAAMVAAVNVLINAWWRLARGAIG